MLMYETDLSALGEPADAEQIAERACRLEEKSVFLAGLSERLNALGVVCGPEDRELMLEEVRKRYKSVLGIPCPRTVTEWVRGTVPGNTSRRNNFELCLALEMDFVQTADFFRRFYLSLPWGCKSRTDAVFLYCIYHRRPYSSAVMLLEEAKGFVPQEKAHTVTAEIFRTILAADDDDRFLDYLSSHCYSSEQQFMTARQKIIEETEQVKERLLSDSYNDRLSPDRLNSSVIAELLNYKYQPDRGSSFLHRLPERYTSSLPNDVTLGRILNGTAASYETLRKTLMLLHFNNFYSEAVNDSQKKIESNLSDFCSELNDRLELCGFAPIYLGHPFDYILLACANNLEPIVTFYEVNERN